MSACVVRSAHGGQAKYTAEYRTGTIALEAGFLPDETGIIFRQPLFITFTVVNLSDDSVTFFVGGDTRGSVRPNSFRITAVDAAGRPVRDPHSYKNYGGHGRNVTLRTGERYTERLYLGLWCAFKEPGAYTVTCERTLRNHGRETKPLSVPVTTRFGLLISPSDPECMGRIIKNLADKLLRSCAPEKHRPAPGADRRSEYQRFREMEEERKQRTYEAALGLASIAEERVIPYLAAVAQDQPHNYRAMMASIEGLAQFSSDEAADILIRGLRHTGNSVRDPSADALRRMKRLDRAVVLFLKELADRSPAVRATAARALGSTKDRRALAPLVKALDHEDVTVRRAAASALGPLGHKEAISPLQRHVTADDAATRVAAARSLHQLGEQLRPEWLTPIIRASTGRNDSSFYEAIRLIRLYGGEEAAPALASCLEFDDPSLGNSKNFRLILAINYSPGGPKYHHSFHHDLNISGTLQHIQENHKILTELKKWLEEHP